MSQGENDSQNTRGVLLSQVEPTIVSDGEENDSRPSSSPPSNPPFTSQRLRHIRAAIVLNYMRRDWWEDGEVEAFVEPSMVECDPHTGSSMPSIHSPPEIKPNPEALIDNGDAVFGDQEPFVICRQRTASEFYALLREQ